MQVVNPATGEVVASFQDASAELASQRIEEAARAFASWRRTPMRDRKSVV